MTNQHLPTASQLDAVAQLMSSAGVSMDSQPLRASIIAGGRSNITYLLTSGDGAWILRRPPLGHVLATAHDMDREYTVMSALANSSGSVPVPATVVNCHDESLLGTPFYVMEMVRGEVLRTLSSALAVPTDQQRALSHHLVDTLAALHCVDFQAAGLSDFGRPDGFMQRQVIRWSKQLQGSRTRHLPGIEKLGWDLAATLPKQQSHAIVHGDYRLDNCVVRDGKVAAVLDWEMSTLGDPLADVGTFVVYYAGLAEVPNDVIQSPAGHGAYELVETLVERYALTTGLDLVNLDWYVAFAWFKLAVISEGIHFRDLQGQALGCSSTGVSTLVIPAIEHGRDTLARWRHLRK